MNKRPKTLITSPCISSLRGGDTEGSRKAWIDNIKFYAIICVVIGHSFSCIKGDFKGYDGINLLIVAFNMPVFALISGVTSFKSLSRINTLSDLLRYINNISWHIGVPTVVYTLIAMAISYLIQLRFDRCLISTLLLILILYSVHFIQYKNSNKIKSIRKFFPYLILPICLINQSVTSVS